MQVGAPPFGPDLRRHALRTAHTQSPAGVRHAPFSPGACILRSPRRSPLLRALSSAVSAQQQQHAGTRFEEQLQLHVGWAGGPAHRDRKSRRRGCRNTARARQPSCRAPPSCRQTATIRPFALARTRFFFFSANDSNDDDRVVVGGAAVSIVSAGHPLFHPPVHRASASKGVGMPVPRPAPVRTRRPSL